MSISCHVCDKKKHKTFLLYIQIHIVHTTVNKYDITWWIIKIQYTGKFDMLTYFFGTNSVVVLSPDCTITITISSIKMFFLKEAIVKKQWVNVFTAFKTTTTKTWFSWIYFIKMWVNNYKAVIPYIIWK